MQDSLHTVFTDEVMGRIQPHRHWDWDHPLQQRFEVLTASGPLPNEPHRRARVQDLVARRAALEAYLDAAATCQLLDPEMLAQLQGASVDGYRGAVGECMAAWLLAGKLGLRVSSKPRGRNGKVLDLVATSELVGQDIYVEVKSPASPLSDLAVRVSSADDGDVEDDDDDDDDDVAYCGDHSGMLIHPLRKASSKFREGSVNVLVVVPEFGIPIWSERDQLVTALIGQPVLAWSINTSTGRSGRTRTKFLANGRLVQRWRSGAGVRRNFTRVSAVVSIEPVLVERPFVPRISDAEMWGAASRGDDRAVWAAVTERLFSHLRPDRQVCVDHEVFVVHNPFAQRPLDVSVFGDFPQLVPTGNGTMHWTDRTPAENGREGGRCKGARTEC